MSAPMTFAAEAVIAETRAWVDRAVIGLNLCPFAKAVRVKNQIRYAVSDAADAGALLDTLREELRLLAGADPAQVETTLLRTQHPHAAGARAAGLGGAAGAVQDGCGGRETSGFDEADVAARRTRLPSREGALPGESRRSAR